MSSPEIRAAMDTSVVMRLLTGQPLHLASIARRYMAEAEQAGAKVFVSNLVVLEAYFACQHHYGMAKDAVITGLQQLLSMPTFVLHPQLLPLLATEGLATAKPGFLDRLIHAEATTAHLPPISHTKRSRGAKPFTRPPTDLFRLPPTASHLPCPWRAASGEDGVAESLPCP